MPYTCTYYFFVCEAFLRQTVCVCMYVHIWFAFNNISSQKQIIWNFYTRSGTIISRRCFGIFLFGLLTLSLIQKLCPYKPKIIKLLFPVSLLSMQHLCSDMYTFGLLYQWASAMKIQLSVLCLVQNGHHHHLIEK